MIIVATSGCFDILHVGHLDLFFRARLLGDVLHVYLNSDESVRRLKGKNRPIVSQAHREALLNGLKTIDYVRIFNEDTPISTIKKLKPNIWVKGGDYRLEDLPEREVVESYGGKVVILPITIDISTSKIIERIKK